MSTATSRSYKLYYFNAYGRAEVTRFLFHLAGVEYEDVRYEFAEWPLKKQEMSFTKVPVLEVDGKRLTESVAIARYVAKEFGMYAEDSWECALIDAFIDNCQEIFEEATDVIKAGYINPQQKEKVKEHFQNTVGKSFEGLEKLVVHGDDFFIGNKITVADLFFFCTCATVAQFATDFLTNCPKLEALHSKVAAHPKVAEWLNTRPGTSYKP